jgi:hypothetical protein
MAGYLELQGIDPPEAETTLLLVGGDRTSSHFCWLVEAETAFLSVGWQRAETALTSVYWLAETALRTSVGWRRPHFCSALCWLAEAALLRVPEAALLTSVGLGDRTFVGFRDRTSVGFRDRICPENRGHGGRKWRFCV